LDDEGPELKSDDSKLKISIVGPAKWVVAALAILILLVLVLRGC